jgi:hypothetical protein
MNRSRRSILKFSGATLVMVPFVAMAAKNDSVRKSLQYQDGPKDGKRCDACVQFVAGKAVTDPAGCKVIPGDTEISPSGWCMAWVKK